MNRLGELRRVELIRGLVCNSQLLPDYTCRTVMAYPGDPNIWMATPIGEKWPIYFVDCPVNQDGDYCPGSKIVIFMPTCDDPDQEARHRASRWLDDSCQIDDCGGKIDWDNCDEIVPVGDDEIRYVATCHPKESWFRRLFGRSKTRHDYSANIVAIEEEDRDEIPDRLPESWQLEPTR